MPVSALARTSTVLPLNAIVPRRYAEKDSAAVASSVPSLSSSRGANRPTTSQTSAAR